MLLVPYLRVPMLLRFFAAPARTAALAQPELQRVVDAALFEPGEWLAPDANRPMPAMIPPTGRAHLSTPAGTLFQELTHSPATILSATRKLLENALELDPGKYAKGGAADVLLYAARLAMRVESFARYLLSDAAAPVRGLRTAAVEESRDVLRNATVELHATLEREVLPLLLSWYTRCRRDADTRSACTLAAHIAFAYDAIAEMQASGLSAEIGSTDADGGDEKAQQLPLFAILSSRVFINVHHEFNLEPRVLLPGQKDKGGAKRSATVEGELAIGFEPLDLFDLWQRSLSRLMRWLHAHPQLGSEVMENVVRLLSGEGVKAPTPIGQASQERFWMELPVRGCEGRFVPGPGGGEGGGVAASAANGSGALVRGGAEVYEAWLRAHVSAVSETEVNVQLGELTLNQHQMQLLDRNVSEDDDFTGVFGQGAAAGRHQCGEIARTEHRHWLRLIAVEHDVQIWDPDPRPMPGPLKLDGNGDGGSAEIAWVNGAMEQAKRLVPALAACELCKMVRASESHALLFALAQGSGPREVMLLRDPLVVHVWRLESHGRRWLPVFEATTDTRHCLAEPPSRLVNLNVAPMPHWTAGAPFDAANDEKASSIVITRPRSHANHGVETRYVPERHLRGLLPEALLYEYRFWQRPDASMRGERRSATGATDELSIEIGPSGEATIRRTPMGVDGTPVGGEARRLLTHLQSGVDTPLHQLVQLLLRLDDASHVLLWSCPDSDAAADEDPTQLPVDIIELPRLRLAFTVVDRGSGSERLVSVEHPGLHVCSASTARIQRLLAGLPHALLLESAEGDAFVLLSALAKPCLLSDATNPLFAQLLLATHAPGWIDALPATRHYFYPVHRSGTYLSPPSLAAALYLLLLRWLSRDYEAAFALCAICVSDTPLTAEESQLWALLADLDDDAEPGAHACRLRLALVTRSCPELQCPWQVGRQLLLYLAKLDFLPPACQLSAADELCLLRTFASESPLIARRAIFLQAAVDGTDNYAPPPPMASKLHMLANRAGDVDEPIMWAAALVTGNSTWRRVATLNYTRPEEASGAGVLKLLASWVHKPPSLDSESKGFWLMYELMTNSLSMQVLADDAPNALGSLLFRLSAHAGAPEVIPLLRLLEAEPALALSMPHYHGTVGKKGVVGALGKSVGLFKGKGV